MDTAHGVRRPRRTRRAFSPTRPDALEGRTLLSLSLLQDINPAGLTPAEITGAGGNVYFVTRAPGGGSDLDVETAAGVATLKAFPATSDSASDSQGIDGLTAVGSRLFFFADAGRRQQLWVTNGTSAGTRLVKDLSPGGGSNPTAVGSELFFTATVTRGTKTEDLLYESDGTAAGTVLVPAPAGSPKSGNDADILAADGGTLYFGSGDRLMKTDGTSTRVVGTFGPPGRSGVVTGYVGNLTVAGGVLYFTSPDASGQGTDLYATDGTAGRTTLLKDFAGTSVSYAPLSGFTAVGSRLFFGVDDAADGPGLWASDGTPAGTALVQALGTPPSPESIASESAGPPILAATAAGDRLFFTTGSSGPGDAGETLWVSDGTSTGTTEVADINPGNTGPYSEPASQLAAIGGAVFFANDDPAHGVELWRSDGTAAGTGLFLDLDPGPAGSFPGDLTVIDNTLYFSATTIAGSSALWSSDGTAAGTQTVASFTAQPDGAGLFANIPDAYAVIGQTMVFAADDGTATELWKTDGTPAGTAMIRVLVPGPPESGPSDFTTVGDRAFFVVTQGSTETLWVTDGTAAGTTEVSTLDGTLSNPLAFDGQLAFLETAPDNSGSSLWLSDGTASGTTEVKAFPGQTPAYGQTSTMAALNGKLYLSAPPPAGGDTPGFFTLWISDGTTAGTIPLAGAPTTANASTLAVDGGNVYFTVDTPRAQLWVTDGTAAGTRKVANVGADNPEIQKLLVAGPDLYIFADVNSSTGETIPTALYLYRPNGPAGRAVLLHRFANGPVIAGAGLPDGDLAIDISGTLANPLPRLWLSDGTAAGTKPVKGIRGGFGTLGTGDGAITPVDGRFFLEVSDAKHGTELWQSDGTVAGTTLVQDINPGPGSSGPYPLAVLDGMLIVAADDGTHGLELLSGPIPPAPAAAGVR